jgi:hypothetical protein
MFGGECNELWVENKSEKKNSCRQSKWTNYNVVQENKNWKEFPMRKSGE